MICIFLDWGVRESGRVVVTLLAAIRGVPLRQGLLPIIFYGNFFIDQILQGDRFKEINDKVI